MLPAAQVIYDHVHENHRRWRLRAADPIQTRAGPRYLGIDVATLLAPPLKCLHLHVYENVEFLHLTGPDGREIGRDRLGDLIASALEDHHDAVLRSSHRSPSFFEHLASRMPYYEGGNFVRVPRKKATPQRSGPRPTSTEYARRARARTDAAEIASARAYLRAVRPHVRGTRVVAQDLYRWAKTNIADRSGQPIRTADEPQVFRVPGPRLFYRVADEEFGPRRRHARGTAYLVRSMNDEVVRLLQESGVDDPEAEADHLERSLASVGPIDPSSPESVVAAALSMPVVAAIASADNPARALALFGRRRINTHPEEAAAIHEAVRLFSPALVNAVRRRLYIALSTAPIPARPTE